MQRAAFRLFIEVAEVGSISKVAALRQTAQSNLSRQLGELEQACGARLFERTGRGVVLTDFGKRILPRVRAWLTDTDQLLNEIKATAGTLTGEVRIGILPSTAHPLITTLYKRLRTAYPEIRLSVRESQLGEVEGWLESGRVDLALLFQDARAAGDHTLSLATIGTYLVGAPDAPATRGPSVEFRQLGDLPLVLPCRPNRLRDLLDETARRDGIVLTTLLEADSLTVQREFAASGEGYAVLGPYAIAADVRSGRLAAARIVAPEVPRFVTLGCARQGSLTPACRVVISLLREISTQLGESGAYNDIDIGAP